MKFRITILCLVSFIIIGCSNVGKGTNLSIKNERVTELLYNEFIEGSPNLAQLNLFFTQMPKGGDLHHHYSGSIYAETFLDWVELQGYSIIIGTLKIDKFPPDPIPNSDEPYSPDRKISVEELRSKPILYRKLLTLWSNKDYNNHYHEQVPPDFSFFNSFGYFGKVSRYDGYKEGLKILKNRALEENVSYIETMLSKPRYYYKDDKIDIKLREASTPMLLKPILEELVSKIDSDTKFEIEINKYIEVIKNAHEGIDDTNFTMRFQASAFRGSNPTQVFASLYSSFKAVEKSEFLVGVNILGPENGFNAIEDYSLHMQMFAFLKEKFPAVKISLHAGELTLGMVRPKNLKFHISQAINVAGADRIGHGVALPYEEEPIYLLNEMKKNSVIEINLTSNEFILGVKGQEHPYLIYSKYGVPIVISTDDSGVSRNNLTGEYVLLATRYKPSYQKIKEYVYNSVKYSFTDELNKKKLKADLDKKFKNFESEMAEYYKLITK